MAKRLVVLCLLPTLLALWPLAGASAAKPVRFHFGKSYFILRNQCDFPVRFADVVNKSVGKDLYDRQGNLVKSIYSGSEKSRLTNLSTGKSIVVNTPGRTKINYQPDGSQIFTPSGSFLLFTLGGFPGVPSNVSLMHGRAYLVIDASGNFVPSDSYVRGTATDVCAELTG